MELSSEYWREDRAESDKTFRHLTLSGQTFWLTELSQSIEGMTMNRAIK